VLESLDKYASALRPHGGDFSEYVEHRQRKPADSAENTWSRCAKQMMKRCIIVHTEDELAQSARRMPT